MNTEILGVVAQIVLLVVIELIRSESISLTYIKVEKTCLDFMKPIETAIYRLSGINPEEEMNWKQFLRALLIVNALLVHLGYAFVGASRLSSVKPGWKRSGQTAHQAFNTCISFMVNCNEQHYSGESRIDLFDSVVRHHVIPVRNSRNRYGCYGRYHEGVGRKDYEDYR